MKSEICECGHGREVHDFKALHHSPCSTCWNSTATVAPCQEFRVPKIHARPQPDLTERVVASASDLAQVLYHEPQPADGKCNCPADYYQSGHYNDAHNQWCPASKYYKFKPAEGIAERAKAFDKAFQEISNACEKTNFRLPNSTDFGFGWRKAEEYYHPQITALTKERDELQADVDEFSNHSCRTEEDRSAMDLIHEAANIMKDNDYGHARLIDENLSLKKKRDELSEALGRLLNATEVLKDALNRDSIELDDDTGWLMTNARSLAGEALAKGRG